MPVLPSFKDGIGAEMCVSILSLAKAGGWEVTLGHGFKLGWFKNNHDMFFRMVDHCVATNRTVF